MVSKKASEDNQIKNYQYKLIEEKNKLAKESSNDTLSIVEKSVSDAITTQIIRTMDSQLISPWSSDLMGRFTKAISNRVQHHWLVDESQNGESQVKEKQRIDELKEKEKSGNLTKEEKEILKNYDPYNTFEKQINSNARE